MFFFTAWYGADTDMSRAAKVLFCIEYDSSDEKCDPTLSPLIPHTSFYKNISNAGQKDPVATHLAELRGMQYLPCECLRGTAARSWKDTCDWCDTVWKKYWQLSPHSSSGSAVSASLSLHPSSAQPRPLHDESRTNLLTLILSPRLA